MPNPITGNTSFTYGLLRHGETVWNSEKRVQGHCNSPLTPFGKTQIQGWADYLAAQGWQRIICSDLGRVRETVAIINSILQLPVTEDTRLREQNWGEWEGMTVDELYRDYAQVLEVQIKAGWDFRPPAGESRSEIRTRIFAALASHREQFNDEKTLVVCHLGVIKCLIYAVAGRSFLPKEPSILQKGCMHTIHYSAGAYRLGSLNITPDHLIK
jgi:probable phosphoglycerate mutase